MSGGHAFGAAYGVGVVLSCQFVDFLGEGFDGCVELLLFVWILGFSGGSEEAVSAVLDFSGNDLSCYGGALIGGVSGSKLGASEHDARIGHACHSGLKVAKIVEVID